MLSRPRLSLASLTLLATLLLQVPASLAQDRVEPSSACLIDREIFSTRNNDVGLGGLASTLGRWEMLEKLMIYGGRPALARHGAVRSRIPQGARGGECDNYQPSPPRHDRHPNQDSRSLANREYVAWRRRGYG